MVNWKGKEVTIAEYRKLKKKEANLKGKPLSSSLKGKEVWWITKSAKRSLYIWVVIEESVNWVLTIDATCKDKGVNPLGLNLPEEIHKDDIKVN